MVKFASVLAGAGQASTAGRANRAQEALQNQELELKNRKFQQDIETGDREARTADVALARTEIDSFRTSIAKSISDDVRKAAERGEGITPEGIESLYKLAYQPFEQLVNNLNQKLGFQAFSVGDELAKLRSETELTPVTENQAARITGAATVAGAQGKAEALDAVPASQRAGVEQALGRASPTLQTDIGKVVGDRGILTDVYGLPETHPAIVALDSILTTQGDPDPDKAFTQAGTLRQQYTTLADTFIQVRDGFRRVQASATDPSPAGDMSLIFGYMKMLDPDSAVLAGEQASAKNAGGVDDRTRATYNALLGTGSLSADQRKDFIDRANKLMDVQSEAQVALVDEYTRIAIAAGLDPGQVIVDFIGGLLDINDSSPDLPPGAPAGSKFLRTEGNSQFWQAPTGEMFVWEP